MRPAGGRRRYLRWGKNLAGLRPVDSRGRLSPHFSHSKIVTFLNFWLRLFGLRVLGRVAGFDRGRFLRFRILVGDLALFVFDFQLEELFFQAFQSMRRGRCARRRLRARLGVDLPRGAAGTGVEFFFFVFFILQGGEAFALG